MAGARLEDCAEWLRMASAQESNNQMAIWGSRRPTEKMWHGNRPVTPAKRKIAARQSTDRAGQKNKSRRGNRGITPASSKNSGAAIGVSRRPLEKSQRGNQGIAPAS